MSVWDIGALSVGVAGLAHHGGVSCAPLAGQVVVVTGASRGIGRAVALHLARRGATVAGLARPSDALVSLRDAAEHEELVLVPIAADVTVPAEVEAAFDVVDTELGPVTFAVTCAGTAE